MAWLGLAARRLPGRLLAAAGAHRGAAARRPEALLEGLHLVDHLGLPPRRGRLDLLALRLGLDHLLDALADLVRVLLGLELVGGDLVDELAGQLQLARAALAVGHR